MRLRRLRLLLLLVAVLATGREVVASPGLLEQQPPPLLPPGARGPEDSEGWVFAPRGAGDATERGSGPLRERIRPAALESDGEEGGWIEVEYTIDRGLEAGVRRVLEREGVRLGHVVLMDPATGDLLAYVSTDPVVFPATRTYPMASLVKVVTAAATLRHTPEATRRGCRYLGSPYRLSAGALQPPREGGSIDPFWRMLAISNNQCFARLAVHDVGEEAILEAVEGVGLLEAPAPGHPPGRFDPVGSALDLGRLGSGLAGSFISPLAAVRLAAVLARGELVRPRWISRLEGARGATLELSRGEAPHRVWSPEIADRLREILVGVTTRGTARRAFVDTAGRPLLGQVRVSGKTGTLGGRDPEGVYQWFIGVAPADQPLMAIAAVVVDGGEGHGASRIAAEVLHELLCEGERCAPELLEGRLAPSLRRRSELVERASLPPDGARVPDPASGSPAETTVLDAMPRPIGPTDLELPDRLRGQPANGRIVLMLELSEAGEVVRVEIDSSDLPEFEEFVASAVRGWRFTPPTRGGRPVEAWARLPIPIRVR